MFNVLFFCTFNICPHEVLPICFYIDVMPSLTNLTGLVLIKHIHFCHEIMIKLVK